MSPELSANEPNPPSMAMRTQNNIIDMLGEIITRLERIEQRQIRTTKLVEEVEKAEETHAVGSFGTTDPGTRNP